MSREFVAVRKGGLRVQASKRSCKPVPHPARIVGGLTVVTIASPTRFTMADKTYRHGSTKAKF